MQTYENHHGRMNWCFSESEWKLHFKTKREKKITEWKWKKKLFKNHFKANRTCDGSCAPNSFERRVMIGKLIGI